LIRRLKLLRGFDVSLDLLGGHGVALS